jgi:hypothetical protein
MPEAAPSRDLKASDDYATRLLKLLPAEITGAYLAIRLISQPESNESDGSIAIFAMLILLISPFFMYFVLKMRQVRHIVFLMFTYVVWISNFEIARIIVHGDQIKSVANNVGPFLQSLVAWLISPDAIKGIAIIWLLLLSPFVFVTEASTAPAPPGPNPAAPVPTPPNPPV